VNNKEQIFQPTKSEFDISKYDDDFLKDRTQIVVDIIRKISNTGDALDLGCGPGFYTNYLSSNGWKTTAVDTGPKNIESASRFANSSICNDAVSALEEFPEFSFDLVLCLELIEHMPATEGIRLVLGINKVLKKGGTMIIATPNRISLEGMYPYYIREKLFKKEKWYAWDPTHVHIYSHNEIKKLITTSGFSCPNTVGFYYKGWFPKIGTIKFPLSKTNSTPMNKFGFSITLYCTKI